MNFFKLDSISFSEIKKVSFVLLLVHLAERIYYYKFYYSSYAVDISAKIQASALFDYINPAYLIISLIPLILLNLFRKTNVFIYIAFLVVYFILNKLSYSSFHVDGHFFEILMLFLLLCDSGFRNYKLFFKFNRTLFVGFIASGYCFNGIFKILEIINDRNFFLETYSYTKYWGAWHLVRFFAEFETIFPIGDIVLCLAGIGLIISSIFLFHKRTYKYSIYFILIYNLFSIVILESWMAFPAVLVTLLLNIVCRDKFCE